MLRRLRSSVKPTATSPTGQYICAPHPAREFDRNHGGSRMKTSALLSALMSLPLSLACSTLGPKANVTLQKKEIKATKTVGNIVVAGVTGVQDPSGVVDKAVATSATAAYGGRARPVEVVKLAMSKIKLGDMADLLTAPYQAEFAKVIEAYSKSGEKSDRPTAMKVPSSSPIDQPVPTNFTDVRQLQAMMKGKQFNDIQKEMTNVMAELKKPGGGPGKMVKVLAQTSTVKPFLVKADNALFDSLDADHILLTYLDGDEAAFNAGKEVHMYAALVNLKTGKFRYFADSKVKKSMTPYNVQIGLMAGSVFSEASDKDQLPETNSGDAS